MNGEIKFFDWRMLLQGLLIGIIGGLTAGYVATIRLDTKLEALKETVVLAKEVALRNTQRQDEKIEGMCKDIGDVRERLVRIEERINRHIGK